MAAETAADLAALFAGSDFATVATLADSCEVKGVFRYEFVEGQEYNGRQATFLAASADLSSVAVDQSIEIASTTYTVRAIEKADRTWLLFLEKPT